MCVYFISGVDSKIGCGVISFIAQGLYLNIYIQIAFSKSLADLGSHFIT